MRVFPTPLFHFDGQEADIERRTLSGGTSIAGEEDRIEVDGGGRVFVEFTDPYLDDDDVAGAFSALSSGLGNTTAIIVPLGNAKVQRLGDVTYPIGGLPWWQEEDFVYEGPDATCAAAALGATSLTVSPARLNGPLRVGMWLSIKHPSWGHRAYKIVDVAGGTAVIRPPLREAVANGTTVELRDPKCVMIVDGDMRSPTSMGWASAATVRFVEYPGALS